MEDNKNTSEEDIFVDEDGFDTESSADHAAENSERPNPTDANADDIDEEAAENSGLGDAAGKDPAAKQASATSTSEPHTESDDSQETVKHTGPRYGKFGWDMPDADEKKRKSDWNAWKQANGSAQQNTSAQRNGTDQQKHAWNQQNDGPYRNWNQQNPGQQSGQNQQNQGWNGNSGNQNQGGQRGPSNGWQSDEPSNGWNERQQNAGRQYGYGNQQQNGYGNRQSYGYNNPQYGQPNGWRQPQGGRYTRPVDSEGRYLGRNLAIWSAVVGVIALSLFGTFINIPLAIIAIVLGVRHLRHYNRNMGRTAAKVGIVTAILSIVLFVGAYGLAATNKSFTNMVEQEMNSGSASSEIQQYLDELYGQDNTDEL